MLLPRVGGDPRREHLGAESAQEALVEVWRQIQAGRGPDRPASFIAWAARIALNKMLDMQRRLEPAARSRATRRVALSRQIRLDAGDDDDASALAERYADPHYADPEDSAACAELRDLVLEIARMPGVSPQSKTVLLKGYLADWTDDELAAYLGTSRNNIHVIRCRDLVKVRSDRAYIGRLRSHLG